jgi:HEAT repeat protein
VQPQEIQAGLRQAEAGPRLLALGELGKPEVDPSPYGADAARCLEHASEAVRASAVFVLGRLGPSSVPALTRAVQQDQPPTVRRCAAHELGTIGPAAAPSCMELCRAMTTPDDALRFEASYALGQIGAASAPWLQRMLQFSDPAVQGAAVDGLGWVGPPAGPAVPYIQALGASPVVKLRHACAAALVKITGDPGAGVPILQRDLRDPDPAVRRSALERIGECQAGGQRAMSDVFGCLRDPVGGVRGAAALTLPKVGADPGQAVPWISMLLQDPETVARANAIMALAVYGPPARSALQALDQIQRGTDGRLASNDNKCPQALHGSIPFYLYQG